MPIDVIIAAGDGRAAKKIFMRNKALLEVDGKPIIRHICETLLECEEIGRIVVVCPKIDFQQALAGLPVELLEQKRNLMENAWEGFLNTLPEYQETQVLTPEIAEKYRDKYVLELPGDIPLLTPVEVREFIHACDMDNYDYCAGITPEEILSLFGPRKGMPGIKMSTFHAREGNFRQNNLHMLKPFMLQNGIELALTVYEYRYQRELINILKSFGAIFRLAAGKIGRTLWIYLLLQISTVFTSLGLKPLARLASYPISRHELESLFTYLLKAKTKIVETSIGGAALDVDNEKDFLILCVRYKDWKHMISGRRKNANSTNRKPA